MFSKGRELYGLYEARTALRQRGYALVVEGYMDVVALAQSGFGNAVATLGTACTAEHVQKLFRFTDSVVFSFDGDAAGRRAAGRALEASLPHATDMRSVRFLFLPPEHDPDSYVRELGAEAFEQPASRRRCRCRASSSRPAAKGCDLDTAEGRARMLAKARPLWGALPDGALQAPAARRAGRARRGCRASELAAPVGRAGQRRRSAGAAPSAAPPARRRRAARAARRASLLDRALWLLLQRSDWWDALDGDDHDLLRGQAAPHGDAVRAGSSASSSSTAR